MAKHMFGDVVHPSTVGTKQWYTVPLSILAHVAALMGLVIVPLVASGALPTPDTVMAFVVTPPPPPQPAPPPTPHPEVAPPPVTTPVNPDLAPLVAPTQFTPEPPPRSFSALAGTPGALPEGVPSSGITSMAAPPPLPTPQKVRPGGDIKEPRKIRNVPPVYPVVAMAARVEGMVIIEATISKDGSVIDARVIRSQPLLDQAALDAVRQWKFTPTTLNGVPVEVLMTVTVNFTLR